MCPVLEALCEEIFQKWFEIGIFWDEVKQLSHKRILSNQLIAAGKVLTGFSVVKTLALGADVCNAARAMMFGECSSGVEWCGVELRE